MVTPSGWTTSKSRSACPCQASATLMYLPCVTSFACKRRSISELLTVLGSAGGGGMTTAAGGGATTGGVHDWDFTPICVHNCSMRARSAVSSCALAPVVTKPIHCRLVSPASSSKNNTSKISQGSTPAPDRFFEGSDLALWVATIFSAGRQACAKRVSRSKSVDLSP